MDALPLIIGISIVALGILYFTFKWDEKEHLFLRLLGSFFFVGLLILIPKVALDYNDNCDFVVNQTNVSGDLTSYKYDYLCENNERLTSGIFYKTTLWFVRIFITYVFVYLNYVIWFKKIAQMKGWLKP